MDDEEQLREFLVEREQEHKDLDETISRLMLTPPIDFLQMQRLKKRKLRLKDEITKLKIEALTSHFG